MKKTFLTILSAIAMVGMMASCEKQPDKPDKPDTPDTPDTPTEIVSIDGNFNDWSALKGAASAEIGEDSAYPGLLSLKAVADDTYIYVYFEYELQEEGEDGNLQTAAPFEIFVNSDNNSATGGYSWLWTDPGYEYMLECETGFLGEGSTVRDMDDMNLYLFDGVDGVDAWAEGGHLTQQEVTAFCESAGTVKSGIATVEVAFLRSVVNAAKAGKATLGIVAYNGGWGTTGVLPQGAAAGEVGLLEVTLP